VEIAFTPTALARLEADAAAARVTVEQLLKIARVVTNDRVNLAASTAARMSWRRPARTSKNCQPLSRTKRLASAGSDRAFGR
jgi:hypothetical protein